MIVFNHDREPADWRRVSRRERCPICDKYDWCCLTGPEGQLEAVLCMRVESANPRPKGGWVHRLRHDDHLPQRNGNGAATRRNANRSQRIKKGAIAAAVRPNSNEIQHLKKGEVYPTEDAAFAELSRRHGAPSATWTYDDVEGAAVGVVVRWDKPDGKKEIRPVARHTDGWRIGGMPDPRPLYCLPELLESDGTVYVVEGEKAADAARSIDLRATCSAHGSKSAAQTDWSPLAGRDVVILPDHDKPGAEYAEAVLRLLGDLSPAPTVRVVIIDTLPGGESMPDSGDLVDWIEAHGNAATPEVLVDNLEELVAEAEPVDLAAGRPRPHAAYQPFPVEALPEPARGFVAAGAKAIGCDPAFLALPLLTALAAAVGTTRRIELKGGWTAPAILWTAVVGESGTSKTPAFRLVMRPVRERQRKALEEHAQREQGYAEDLAFYDKALAQWKRNDKATDPPPIKPDPPQASRMLVSDTTVEALAPILLANPRGVLLGRDELAGWIGSFDRYSGGKGGSDSAHWLSMHNGESIVVDRKTGVPRTIMVPEAAVWVAGGIQPAVLNRALGAEHRESGLAARLLLACPSRTPKRWTEADVDPAAERELAELVDRLYSLEPVADESGVVGPGVLRLSADAKAVWKRYYNAHGREQTELSGELSAAWSKLEEYAARLALVVHVIRWAAGDLPEDGSGDNLVDAVSMSAGVELATWFKHEARRVYRVLGEDGAERTQRQLAEWIEGKGGSVTAREVQQGRRDCPTAATAEAALEELVQAGWGAWSVTPPTTKGGRPSRMFVLSTASTSTQPHDSRG